MDYKLKFDFTSSPEADGMVFSVRLDLKEYARAIEAVPNPGELQGIEHTPGIQGKLERLAKMVEFLRRSD